ncbi:MAG TPA: anti-sigma factor, partial [Acidobacteriaceae bacterium]|nr:anti-sigma factor [Acidobacteriaceae bacterium]
MNCELAQEDIVLAVYGELPDDRTHRLEQHLAHCEGCRQEMEAISALHKAMSANPPLEPSPSLVARTRLRLDEALDAIPQGGLLRHIGQSFRRGLGHLQGAPVLASTLLLAGISAGAFGGYHYGRSAVATALPPAAPDSVASVPVAADLDAAQIAGVSNVNFEPGSDTVEVRFYRVLPETAFGTIDDPQIRQLLVLGTRNRGNPTVHDSSVDLLAQACRAGHNCSGGPIRNALMVALRYDHDASVRRKALEGLEPYIGVDMRVRDAILEALLHDRDASVRSEAIGLLEPIEADSSV